MLLTILPNDKAPLIVGVCFGLITVVLYIIIFRMAIAQRKRMKVNEAGELLNEGEDMPVDEFTYGWKEDDFH